MNDQLHTAQYSPVGLFVFDRSGRTCANLEKPKTRRGQGEPRRFAGPTGPMWYPWNSRAMGLETGRCPLQNCRTENRTNGMIKVKDTRRATVHLTFDGRVIKVYHGIDAGQRFENEVMILRHLQAAGCDFVPRLLEADSTRLRIVTTNCGSRVEHIDDQRMAALFSELETFGVRHDDPDRRNVTYRPSDGRFCVIDFEFASLVGDCD
jgi:hypothetical protein